MFTCIINRVQRVKLQREESSTYASPSRPQGVDFGVDFDPLADVNTASQYPGRSRNAQSSADHTQTSISAGGTPTSAGVTPTSSVVTPTSAGGTPTSARVTPTSAVVTPTSAVVTPTSAGATPTSAIVTPTSARVTPTSTRGPPTSYLMSPISAKVANSKFTRRLSTPTKSYNCVDLSSSQRLCTPRSFRTKVTTPGERTPHSKPQQLRRMPPPEPPLFESRYTLAAKKLLSGQGMPPATAVTTPSVMNNVHSEVAVASEIAKNLNIKLDVSDLILVL